MADKGLKPLASPQTRGLSPLPPPRQGA